MTTLHRSRSVCADSYLFTDQFVNDLGRALMVCCCLGHKVINSLIRQPLKAQSPNTQPVTAVRPKGNFIIGHIRKNGSCYLLQKGSCDDSGSHPGLGLTRIVPALLPEYDWR